MVASDVTNDTAQPISPVTYSLLALAGVGCLVYIVKVRGGENWSGLLALVFFGLVVGAIGLSVVGGVAAFQSRRLGAWQRLFCIAVGILVPALIAFYAWVILTLVSTFE
jgi:hypothetical protein